MQSTAFMILTIAVLGLAIASGCGVADLKNPVDPTPVPAAENAFLADSGDDADADVSRPVPHTP